MAIVVVNDDQLTTLSELADRLAAIGLQAESHTLRRVLAEIQHRSDEVPATIAAQILEVTPRIIRNWVKAEILPGRRDRTGRYYVKVEALRPAIEMRQAWPDTPLITITDEEIDAEIDLVRAERRSRATPK